MCYVWLFAANRDLSRFLNCFSFLREIPYKCNLMQIHKNQENRVKIRKCRRIKLKGFIYLVDSFNCNELIKKLLSFSIRLFECN